MIQHPNKYRRPNPAMLLTSSKAKANALAKGGSAVGAQLVSQWKLNEGTGSTLHDTVSGYNLTASSTVAWSTLTGYAAECLVVTTNPPIITSVSPCPTALQFASSTSPFSVTAWFNATAGGSIINTLDGSNSYQGWRLGVINDIPGQISCDLISNGNGALQMGTSGLSLAIGNTYFVAFTYNGSRNPSGVAFYLNGSPCTNGTPATNNLTGPINTTGPLNLCSVTNSFDYQNGDIADVRVYSGVLSAAAVAALYSAGPA